MKTKKRANSRKKVTLGEFRAWLEGVEELQPDGWHPDATQWELIRNKINNIIADAPQQPAPAAQPLQQQVSPTAHPGQPIPTQPSTSLLPSAPGPDVMNENAQKLLAPQGGKSVTPDIDSTDGYRSEFT